MRRLTVLLAPVLLAGCGLGSTGSSVERGRAEQLVLQQADVPAYVADSSAGGREEWTRRYRRSTDISTGGPLTIESSAQITDSSDGARERLSDTRGAFEQSGLDWQPIGEPGLGGESFASTLVQGTKRSYEVVWRDANVVARLSVNGREGGLAFGDVLALAEKQERRITDAKS